jgi:hypothetical protein
VSPAEFASHRENCEDVVLWRALSGFAGGTYLDVRSGRPRSDSVSKAFYEHGWSGIAVEPDATAAKLHRVERPRDVVVQAAAADRDGDRVDIDPNLGVVTKTLDSILHDAGWGGRDIHFAAIETAESEVDILKGLDLTRWRPWVLVLGLGSSQDPALVDPAIDELLATDGYGFCLFDGLSRFYVSKERSEQLGTSLSYPACARDLYTTRSYRQSLEEATSIPLLVDDALRWRREALTRWGEAMAESTEGKWKDRYDELSERHHNTVMLLEDTYRSSSWRVTRPMRYASSIVLRLRRRS